MAGPLLNTKIFVPTRRPNLVPRPHLIQRLDVGLQVGRKLSLVSAPAGYGKTTLFLEWINTLRERGVDVSWLSLDEEDNDPVRFWTYWVSALQKVFPNGKNNIGITALGALQSPNIPDIETLLIGLINEIMELSGQVVLVMDDLHLITDTRIQDGLSFLVENLNPIPRGLHLGIATRTDPPWPMARLRSRNELTEIRAFDLRFNREETQQFFHLATGYQFKPETVQALDQRTEGWVAGLQMAAISIQQRHMQSGLGSVAGFVESFSGSNRFVLDFLIEEVLSQQPPDIQEFLYKTSILRRMSAPLCNAVTGRSDSQQVLERLDRMNLFMVTLDDKRLWFRYHALFADLLRSRQGSYLGSELVDLNNRASLWFEENGWLGEAVQHALEAENFERVAALVETNAFKILDVGGMATLLSWLKQIPESIRQARPRLGIAYAWVLVYAGELDAGENILQHIESDIQDLRSVDYEWTLGQLNSIRAYTAWIKADGEAAVDYAHQALLHLPGQEITMRAFVTNTMAQALVQNDELARASEMRQDAMNWGLQSGNAHVYYLAASGQAFILIQMGKLSEAEAICLRALAFAQEQVERPGGQSPALAQIYSMLSTVYLWRNELEQALEFAQKGLELGKRWAQVDTLTLNYVYLGITLLSAGDLVGMSEAIQNAKRVGLSISSWFESIILTLEAEYNLAKGNLVEAERWLKQQGMDIHDPLPQAKRNGYRTLARILSMRGEWEEASILLERLIQVSEKSGGIGFLISVLTMQSVVLAELGRQDEGLELLEKALHLAQPELIRFPFIRAGNGIVPLLYRAASGDIAPDFAKELIEIFLPDRGRMQVLPGSGIRTGTDRSKEAELGYIEPLTEREVEVLRLLDSSLSVPEIADELYIAASTVRSHTRSIYAKLDVHGRIEAVYRAKELGLM